MSSMPSIIAHRGASWTAPENTLAAAKLAWQEGADAVEADFLDGLSVMACAHVDAHFVRTVKESGLALWVWTVDELDEAQWLIAAGIDSLTTHRPGRVREQLRG